MAVVLLTVGLTHLWPQAGESPASTPQPPAQQVLSGTTLKANYCGEPASGPFVPTSITIPGITRRAPVLALPRDANDIPSPAPLTEAGKHEFAWDRSPSPMPGADRGNVLLNAHTWPWTSAPALGNLMLEGLRPGDRIIVRGADDHQCYRVTKMVEIRADQDFPAYYATTGAPQLAFMVCSGERRGPGDWVNRMIWFASPETAPETAPGSALATTPGQAPQQG
jgi:hypothetical protein